MLQIKTIKNHLIADKEKEAFCFRSVASQTLDENALIKEMLSYNSSFTEADISGLFSVLGTVVNKYLAKGYNVILPFGALRANATGTCETINTSFSQGTGNHQIGFIFNPSEKTLSEVNKNLEYKQVLPDSTKEGKIYRISGLDDDAKEIRLKEVDSKSKIRISGRNLTFDSADEAQGVFLENETGITRISKFDRKGSNIIDFHLPESLLTGEYSVSIVTKPGKEYRTATTFETIKLSETE